MMTVRNLSTGFDPREGDMQLSKNKVWVTMVMTVFLMTVVTTPTLAQDPTSEVCAESMAADFIVLRPLGLAVTAIGCVFYVATLPFTVWSGKRNKQARDNFLIEPAVYTFIRPLGELE